MEDLGHHVAASGQKTHNGVALVSTTPFERVIRPEVYGWSIPIFRKKREVKSEHFRYKLDFIEGMGKYLRDEGFAEQAMIWLRDLNVAMDQRDVYDPERLYGRVCFHPDEQVALKEATNKYIDIFRKHISEKDVFTFWDYRVKNRFKRNIGGRIDHIFASQDVAATSKMVRVDTYTRALESLRTMLFLWLPLIGYKKTPWEGAFLGVKNFFF